jgi:hypothetical protein
MVLRIFMFTLVCTEKRIRMSNGRSVPIAVFQVWDISKTRNLLFGERVV